MKEAKIIKTPPTIAEADLVAIGAHNAVLLLKDTTLWIYERYGRQCLRSTPTVVAAEEASFEALLNRASISFGITSYYRNNSAKYLELLGNTKARCMNCNGIETMAKPCTACNPTRCNLCKNPTYGNPKCAVGHCSMCCDCWYGRCGCYFAYKHEEKPPTHYYWSFGDTMHEALSCGQCWRHCGCKECSCGKFHVGAGKNAYCTTCRAKDHVTECCLKGGNPYSTGRGARLEFKNYGPAPTFYESKTFEKNQCRRFLSPEIEIASLEPTDYRHLVAAEATLGKLKIPIVLDLSIPDGVELNVQPANGDVFLDNIAKITKVVGTLQPYVNERCGLHVHVDARDFSTDDLAKMLLLFCKIEPLVYNLVDRRRKTTKYCGSSLAYLPYAKQGLDLEELKSFLYGGSYEYQIIKQKQKKNTSSQDIRYRGLNLHSFFYRGTLEFRHHHGSVNAAEIVEWALFCGFLLDASKFIEWEQLSAIPDNIKTPTAFIKELRHFPTDFPNIDQIVAIIKKRYKQFTNPEEEEAVPPTVRAGAPPPRRVLRVDTGRLRAGVDPGWILPTLPATVWGEVAPIAPNIAFRPLGDVEED